MVQAVININEHTEGVSNIVDAKFWYKVKLAKIVSGKHLSREELEKELI